MYKIEFDKFCDIMGFVPTIEDKIHYKADWEVYTVALYYPMHDEFSVWDGMYFKNIVSAEKGVEIVTKFIKECKELKMQDKLLEISSDF